MRRPAAVLLALIALTLAGCAGGASGTTSSTVSDVAPAAGEVITGTGYSYTVPEGWAVPDQNVPAGTDSFAADLTDTDGFADNVNVVLSPAGKVTPDQVETAGADELTGAGATDVQVLDRVSVAGSESSHLHASLSSQGATYDIEQYYVSSDDQTYVVTFSFSSGLPEGDRVDTAESVLATWTWA